MGVNKAEVVPALWELFPEVFVEGKDVRPSEFDVHVQDMMIKWYHIKTEVRQLDSEVQRRNQWLSELWPDLRREVEQKTPQFLSTTSLMDEEDQQFLPNDEIETRPALGIDLMFFITQSCTKHVANTGTRVFAICFDKEEFVPPNKGMTQSDRKKQLEKSGKTPLEWDGHSPIITFDGELPDWSRLNANRLARRRAIRELCVLIGTWYRPRTLYKEIIIDGWSRDGEIPWRIWWDDERCGYRMGKYEQARNRVGEGEHAMFFHMKRLMPDPEGNGYRNVITNTTDTDGLWMNLMHARARIGEGNQFLNQVMHFIGFKNIQTDTRRLAKPKAQRKTDEEKEVEEGVPIYVDINQLYILLCKKLPKLRFAPETFVTAATSAKSDYVKAFMGLPSHWFIKAILLYSNYIGDLLAMDAKSQQFYMNVGAYARLIKITYALCSQSKLPYEDLSKAPANKVWEARRECKSKESWWAPVTQLKHRARHSWWYMLYMLHSPDNPDRIPDPLLYSYTKILQDYVDEKGCKKQRVAWDWVLSD